MQDGVYTVKVQGGQVVPNSAQLYVPPTSVDPFGGYGIDYIIGGIILVALIAWYWAFNPKYQVWRAQKQGEADLAQAHKDQQIQVAKAQGRVDAATLNKQAAQIEAEAVALQITTIGTNLKEHNLYLQWQQIEMMKEHQGAIIYVPTEAGLPILEAGKRPTN